MISTAGLIVVLITICAGCDEASTVPDQSTAASVPEAIPPHTPLKLDVKLMGPTDRPHVVGTTNLPTGTSMSVSAITRNLSLGSVSPYSLENIALNSHQ